MNERVSETPSEVVARFFHLLDRDRMTEAAELFAPQGEFVRGSQRLDGRQALLEAFSMKPSDQIVRHLMANIVTDFVATGDAVVQYDLSVYVQRPGECGGTPGLSYIVNGLVTCRPGAQGWQIASMLTEQAFRTETPLFK